MWLWVVVPDDTFSLSLSIDSLGFIPGNMIFDMRISGGARVTPGDRVGRFINRDRTDQSA